MERVEEWMNYKRKCMLVMMCLTLLAVGCNLLPKTNKNQDVSKPVEIELWYGLNGYSNQAMKGLMEEFNASQFRRLYSRL